MRIKIIKIAKNVVYVAIISLCIVAMIKLNKPYEYVKEHYDDIVSVSTPVLNEDNTIAGYNIKKDKTRFVPYSIAFALAFTSLGVLIAENAFLLVELNIKSLQTMLKKMKEKKQRTEEQVKLDRIAKLKKELQELEDGD